MRIKQKKLLLPVLILISLFLSVSQITYAETLAEKPERFFDEEAMIPEPIQGSIKFKLEEFQYRDEADIVVLATTKKEGKTLEEVAKKFYEDGGFGVGDDHSGVIIATEGVGTDLMIIPFGGAEEILTADRIESLSSGVSSIESFSKITYMITQIGDYYRQGPPEPWIGNTVVGKGNLANKPQRLFDQAELFSPEENKKIENEIDALRKKINIDIVIQTTNNTQDTETKMYAADFYDYGGFGVGETHDGIEFIINMDQRDFYLVTTGNMIATFSDRRIQKIVDLVTPAMVEEDYPAAIQTVLLNVEKYVESGPPDGWKYNKETGQAERYQYLSPLKVGVSLIFGLIAAIIFAVIVSRKYQLKGKVYSYPYYDYSDADVQVREDNKISDFVTQRTIRTNNNSSGGFGGGGGGSSTFSGSSGTSHGGGGGSF